MSTRKLRLRQGKGLVNTRKKFPPRKAGEDNEDNEDNEEDGRPYYVDEDPEVEPSRDSLISSCFTTSSPTRSQICRLPRKNIHTDTKNEFDVKRDECAAVVREIMDACEESGKKFFDPSFYFDKQENVFPPGTPDDCTVGLPARCMRLSELFGEDCEVFVQGEEDEIDDPVDASDIVQGSIGDCFLIGAISGIAGHGLKVAQRWDKEDAGEVSNQEPSVEHEAPIERLLVAYDVNAGVYGVMFFKMGQWEWVIIDDLVPMSPDDEEIPLFANCKVGDMELWPMVLEKAYAKVHHNWDAIDGGFAGQAVKDMTGGVMQVLDLHGKDAKYKWTPFLRHAQDSLTVMGAACGDHVEEEEGEGQCGEAKGVFGLIKGHAYTVLSAYGEDGPIRLVKVRNPWGNEAEWTGDWSDRSEMWSRHPEVAEAVQFEPKDDGTFWMSWEDLKYYLSSIEIVRFFPGTWRIMTHYGQASRNERDNTYIVHVAQSGDPPAKAVFVLGQSDSRCAHSIVDDVEEAHLIQKGQSEWNGTVSEKMKLDVSYLGASQPPTKIAKLKKVGKRLPNGSSSGEEAEEVVWVEQRVLKVGYYMVTVSEMEEGIEYYLRVHFNPEGELSSWHLPKGKGSALGYSQFEVEEDYDDEEEGDEEEDDFEDDGDDSGWESDYYD